jgi:hypothetical protein
MYGVSSVGVGGLEFESKSTSYILASFPEASAPSLLIRSSSNRAKIEPLSKAASLEALKCSNSLGRRVSRLLCCSGDRLRERGVCGCQRITVSSVMVEVKEGERSASSRTFRGVMGRSDVSIR